MADLNTLRADLGRVNELLADARAREIATVLAQLKEDVALLKITEKEIRVALGYDKVKTKGPAKYYDPQTGKKWSGKGKRPKWLEGKQLEDYLVGAPQPQAWWPGEE